MPGRLTEGFINYRSIMAGLTYSDPYILKCPICGEQRFEYFKFISSNVERTIYSCKCKNEHSSLFFITVAARIVMGVFQYTEGKDEFDYSVYLQSQEWKDKSKLAKQKAGWRCQLCNKPGDDTTLHSHHRTYENIGNEKQGDIIVLCQNCHAKFHDKEKI